MRLWTRSLFALAALGLLAAPSASAARVGWNETAKVAGAKVMSYRVTSVTIGKASWSARISFTNLSRKPIEVGNRFGVSFYGDGKTESLSAAIGFAVATEFSVALPKTIAPGASWSGVISGSGSLSATGPVWTRVVFGPFTGLPGESASVVWVTDHATTVGTAASGSGGSGNVI